MDPKLMALPSDRKILYSNRELMIRLILVLFICLIFSCGSSTNLGGGFTVDYVDIPRDKNVFYQDQGIFGNLVVTGIIFDENLILVQCTDPEKASNDVYYSIDKIMYANNPSQLNSPGLNGPLSYAEFEIKKSQLKNSRTLSW